MLVIDLMQLEFRIDVSESRVQPFTCVRFSLKSSLKLNVLKGAVSVFVILHMKPDLPYGGSYHTMRRWFNPTYALITKSDLSLGMRCTDSRETSGFRPFLEGESFGR